MATPYTCMVVCNAGRHVYFIGSEARCAAWIAENGMSHVARVALF